MSRDSLQSMVLKGLGLVMAAAGGFLVTMFKPVHAAPAKPAAPAAATTASPAPGEPERS